MKSIQDSLSKKLVIATTLVVLLSLPLFVMTAKSADVVIDSTANTQTLVNEGQQVKVQIDQRADQIEQIKVQVSNAVTIAQNRKTSTDVTDSNNYQKAIDYGNQLIKDCDTLSNRVDVLVGQYNVVGTADLNSLKNSLSDLTTILTNLNTRLDEMNTKLDKLNDYLDQLVNTNNGNGKDDSLIDKRFQNKIVYKNSASDSACRSDCNARSGVFNSCGTTCEPNAQNCIAVCAKTCTGFEDSGNGNNDDLVSEAQSRLTTLRTNAGTISGKVTEVRSAVSRAESEMNSNNNSAIRQKLQRAIDYGNGLIADMETLQTRANDIADRLDTQINQNMQSTDRLRKVIQDIERTITALDSKTSELLGKLDKLNTYIDNVLSQWQTDRQTYDRLIGQANTTSTELWQEIDQLKFRSGDIESAISLAQSHDRNDNSDYGRKIDRAIKYGEELRKERDYLENRTTELINERNVNNRTDIDLKSLNKIIKDLSTLLTRLDGRIVTLNQKIDKLNNYLDLVINHQPPPLPTSPPPSPTPTKSPTPTPTKSPSPSPSASPSPSITTVSIQSSGFSPANITVKSGTKVTWKNNDSTAHSLSTDIGGLTSGNIPSGGTFSIKFVTVGSYSYHDTQKPEVKGTVTVTQ